MRVGSVDASQIRAAVMDGWEKVAKERLGPAIRDDAKRFCPVDRGDLRDSIEDSYDQATGTLIVSARGSDDRAYAAYVELGHRVYHPSTGAVGPEVVAPEPFLRPSLYTVRAL